MESNFRPYSTLKNAPRYRFGTEKYLDYMTDLFTMLHYDRMIPFEDDLEKEAAYGELLWPQDFKLDAVDEGWMLLITEMVFVAILDYLETWRFGYYSLNYYLGFLKDNMLTEPIYNFLEYLLRTEPKWKVERIVRGCHKRFRINFERRAKENGRKSVAAAESVVPV